MPESPASGAGEPLELPEPLDDPLSVPELVEPLASDPLELPESDPLELPDTTSPHLSGAPDASICAGEALSAAPASIGAAWSPQESSKDARQKNRAGRRADNTPALSPFESIARMIGALVHEPVRAASSRVKNR
jgi:hypothetical protein